MEMEGVPLRAIVGGAGAAPLMLIDGTSIAIIGMLRAGGSSGKLITGMGGFVNDISGALSVKVMLGRGGVDPEACRRGDLSGIGGLETETETDDCSERFNGRL